MVVQSEEEIRVDQVVYEVLLIFFFNFALFSCHYKHHDELTPRSLPQCQIWR